MIVALLRSVSDRSFFDRPFRSVSDRPFFDRFLDRFSIVLSLIVLRSVSDRPFFDRS